MGAGFVSISGVYNMMQPFATGFSAGWSLGAKNALFRYVNLWSERTRWLASDVSSVLNFSPGARIEQTLLQLERDQRTQHQQVQNECQGQQELPELNVPGLWSSLVLALSRKCGDNSFAVPTGFNAGEIAAAAPSSFDRLLTVDELRSK